MIYYFLPALVVSVILFYTISKQKKEKKLWPALFCLGLVPFIAMLLAALFSFINGCSLKGITGGIDSSIFAIRILFEYIWYVYIIALILLVISIYKVFIKK